MVIRPRQVVKILHTLHWRCPGLPEPYAHAGHVGSRDDPRLRQAGAASGSDVMLMLAVFHRC